MSGVVVKFVVALRGKGRDVGNQRTLPDSGQRTLECGHQVLYRNVPPKVGAKVWCTRCDRPRRVAAATKRGDAA